MSLLCPDKCSRPIWLLALARTPPSQSVILAGIGRYNLPNPPASSTAYVTQELKLPPVLKEMYQISGS